MKTLNNIFYLFLSLFLVLGIGCSDNPMSSENKDFNLPETENNTQSLSLNKGDGESSFFKYIVFKWINREKGGELLLDIPRESSFSYSGNNKNGNDIYGIVQLTIKPTSIDRSRLIMLKMKNKKLEFIFRPSSTNFSPEALLNINLRGVEFENENPENVDLFYLDKGNWKRANYKTMQVDKKNGTVVVVNAKVSRLTRFIISEPGNLPGRNEG